jgi:hypothetical protein
MMKSTTLGSPEDIYAKYMSFNNVMLEQHLPLEIAAIMMTQALSIYRTVLTEEDYNKIVDSISELRDRIHTFKGNNLQ